MPVARGKDSAADNNGCQIRRGRNEVRGWGRQPRTTKQQKTRPERGSCLRTGRSILLDRVWICTEISPPKCGTLRDFARYGRTPFITRRSCDCLRCHRLVMLVNTITMQFCTGQGDWPPAENRGTRLNSTMRTAAEMNQCSRTWGLHAPPRKTSDEQFCVVGIRTLLRGQVMACDG